MFATLHEHRRNTDESFSIKFKSAVGLATVALVAVGALGFLSITALPMLSSF
jgi:hypothetical protein